MIILTNMIIIKEPLNKVECVNNTHIGQLNIGQSLLEATRLFQSQTTRNIQWRCAIKSCPRSHEGHVSVLRWPTSTQHHAVCCMHLKTTVQQYWPGLRHMFSYDVFTAKQKKNCRSSHLFNLRFLYLLQSDSDLLSFLFGSLFLLNIHIRTQSPHGNTFWIIVTLIIAWSNQFPVVKHLDIWWSLRVHNPYIYLAFPARCHCLFRPWRTIKAVVQKHKKQGKGLKTSSTMTSVGKHNLLLAFASFDSGSDA